MVSQEYLDIASRAFLRAAKKVITDRSKKHAAEVKGAFVGGTAVNHLAPNYRGTTDIDIQISGLSKLDKGYDRKKLKRDIIRYCGTAEGIKIPIWSDNGESFCGLTYTLLGSDKKPKAYIKIDIIDSSVTGWSISSSKILTQLHTSNGELLPFAARDDILCTKVKSAYDRNEENPAKGQQDVLDMMQIIYTNPGPVTSTRSIEHLEKYLPRVYKYAGGSGWSLEDWGKALGIKLKRK